jgi:hypothetical protein
MNNTNTELEITYPEVRYFEAATKYSRNPYNVSNKARVARLSSITLRPYDY